jgi:hypothetical protein
MANLFSVSAHERITGQSLSDPITIPTSGCLTIFISLSKSRASD